VNDARRGNIHKTFGKDCAHVVLEMSSQTDTQTHSALYFTTAHAGEVVSNLTSFMKTKKNKKNDI